MNVSNVSNSAGAYFGGQQIKSAGAKPPQKANDGDADDGVKGATAPDIDKAPASQTALRTLNITA
jgi:hypothetical protein